MQPASAACREAPQLRTSLVPFTCPRLAIDVTASRVMRCFRQVRNLGGVKRTRSPFCRALGDVRAVNFVQEALANTGRTDNGNNQRLGRANHSSSLRDLLMFLRLRVVFLEALQTDPKIFQCCIDFAM